MEVLQKCLKSDCLLLWSAEDTFDTSEGFKRSFHILEVLGGPNGVEVSCLLSLYKVLTISFPGVHLNAETQQGLNAIPLMIHQLNKTAS